MSMLHLRHNSFSNPNIEIRKDFLDRAVDNQTTECVASVQQDPGTEFRHRGGVQGRQYAVAFKEVATSRGNVRLVFGSGFRNRLVGALLPSKMKGRFRYPLAGGGEPAQRFAGHSPFGWTTPPACISQQVRSVADVPVRACRGVWFKMEARK